VSTDNRMSDDNGQGEAGTGVPVTLEARPDRQLILPTGSTRHIAFTVRVGQPAARPQRRLVTVGLVLDRSGSMHGEPLQTAKRTAQAVVDQLSPEDRVAVVVFDDRIETVQPLALATSEVKEHVRRALDGVEARGSTALHEGWLTGCRTIASDDPEAAQRVLARCFLLTDGQANVGETDPERIATEAGAIRENAGISTSTLGFGPSYNELLLGPMAVAGGGQFQHLRTVEDIAHALTGELGDLLLVAAMRVRLEIEAVAGMTAEVISAYRQADPAGETHQWSIGIGDLLGGEERHLVVRFGFPGEDRAYTYTVRARVRWTDDAGDHTSGWEEVRFSYGSHEACAAEAQDPAAMHWIGLDYADRARRHAIELQHTNRDQAREYVRQVADHIASYAGDDADLLAAVRALRALERDLEERPLAPMMAKEMYATSQRRSRGQKDFRSQQ
jgi:Ca-activated chloride channel homolog